MKKITNTLMCASLLLAAVLGINSCRKPSVEGDVVRFSARTFSSPLTKTAYSGEVSGGVERIDWRDEDELTIACDQCTPKSANYLVTGATSNSGAVTPVSGNGLQWGTGSHTFYAAYPAGSATVTTAGVASATIPASQGGTGTAKRSAISAGVTTVSMVPDMSNAFMYAMQTATPGNNVELTFYPMFTAFQFTVGGDGTGDDYVTLKSVELSSTSCALSGYFSLDIDDNTYDIPSVVTTGESANNKITYRFPDNTTINTNQKVCFTLFVQPSSNVTGNANHEGMAGVITDLTIRFKLGDDTTRALKLKYAPGQNGGAFVDFPGGKKINIDGLTLPTQLNNWSFTVLNVNAWGSDTPDVLYGSPDVVDPGSDTPDVLYGSPQVVEPGEGWIAETFAPDVVTPGEGWIAETFAPDVTDLMPWDGYEVCSPGICFSVSEYRKVRFSPGNLQAVFAAAGTSFTWQFAENQWSYVGNGAAKTSIDGNGSVSAAGTVDQFGWSTSTTTFGIHKSQVDSDYSGGFVDWGLSSGWRTLSSAEWIYLLEGRGAGAPGYPRYCKATVNDVPGLVIFPDDYSHPSGVTDPDTASVNTSGADFTSNSWAGTDWTAMESAGCVFLPAAGFRVSSASVHDASSSGRYWTSTPNYSQDAYQLFFDSSRVNPTFHNDLNGWRSAGLSVRLVRNL